MGEGKYIPRISSRLRHHVLEVPAEARAASGIVINGRRIKTLVFTTDIAIIRNCNADAVLAVYPFTPQPTISDAILRYSSLPVFCGVGGGTTQGLRTTQLAWGAESQGAMGVVVNAPMCNEDVESICKVIDIPLVVTILNENADIASRLEARAMVSPKPETDALDGQLHPNLRIYEERRPVPGAAIPTVSPGSNAAAAAEPEFAVQLRKLHELKEAGIITEPEFETKKAAILEKI